MQIVRLADTPTTPWKNGGGLTRELLRWPNDSHWQLRISVAGILRSGPFSAYPGVMRWFAVLQGAGVRLHFADRDCHLTPASAALHFDGALAPECTLLEGPTLDLNLMLRPADNAAVMTRALPGQPWATRAPLRAVYTLHACTLHRDGQTPLPLPAASLAYDTAAGGEAWHLEGAALHAWWLAYRPGVA